MHNTDEMKRLHERGLLPAKFAKLVDVIGLDDVTDEAIDEVRKVAGLTEGQNLINRIAAKMLGAVIVADEQTRAVLAQELAEESEPVDIDDQVRFASFLDSKGLTIEEFDDLSEPERVILSDEYSKWTPEPDTQPEQLTPEQPAAEQAADASQPVDPEPPAQPETQPGNAAEEAEVSSPDAAASPDVTEQPLPQSPAPDPLDHDGDGEKGGSLKGEQSTAAKGAAKKRSKPKAKPKSKGSAARSARPKAGARS